MRSYIFSKAVRDRKARVRFKAITEIINKGQLFQENKGDKELLYREVKSSVDLYYVKYKTMTRGDINALRRYAWESEFHRKSWKRL